MRRENAGQIRVLEAFFAVLVVFSAFTVTTSFTVSPNNAKREDLASIGLQALLKLDSDGSLGNYVSGGNWSLLRDVLDEVLPIGVCFNLTVYDDQMQQVNSATVANGGLSNQEIAFVEYVCASRNPVFNCYTIHIWLAVAS